MTKPSISKNPAKKARASRRKSAPKVAVQKAYDTHRKTSPKVAAAETVDTQRRIAAQIEEFREPQVPDTMRALAERNVAQTRQLYERSKNALQAVLESWDKSFGAAGQGAMALNRKILDVADRNINSSFDLAAGLAGAKNLGEVMELQAAYWRKQLGEFSAQAKEVRELSIKAASKVADQSKPL